MLSLNQKEKIEMFIKSYLESFTFYKKDLCWCYEDGVVLNGVYHMYEATKDSYYLNYLINHFDKCISEDGKIKTYDPDERNIDNVEEAYTLFKLNQIHHQEKYDKALESIKYQLSIMPRTESGSFWHKNVYPYQIWLDGLYMGMPIYALFANQDDNLEQKRDILNQFKNVDKYNYNPENNSYMHCYDETKSMQWADKITGQSPNVWLRSVGWLGMASCDVYEVFKATSYHLQALYLNKFLRKVLDSLKPHQDPKTKLYYDLVLLSNQQGNYIETSGSLMVAYSYLKGARLKMLDNKDNKDVEEGISMLSSVIDNYIEGDKLNNVCKVSGLDNKKRNGSVEYYLSEEVCSNDAKACGPLMMAYSEYLTYEKTK